MMTHKDALRQVCAICTNLCGFKAVREVNPEEEILIQTHVFPAFIREYDWFPQGLCVKCIHDLAALNRDEQIN